VGVQSSPVMTRAPWFKNREGEIGTRSPPRFWNPLRVRRVRWMPADLVWSTGLLGRRLRHRKYRNVGAASGFRAELNATIDLCEQRVIRANADVPAGMPLGTALTHDDIAGDAAFAAEQLHAEALARRVAPVARGAACFFVSHDKNPCSLPT